MTVIEEQQLVTLLKKLEPGYFPIEIFWEFCRLCKLTVIELLPCFKDEDNNVKVLLTKRPDNDRFWPGKYHNPGCIVRQGDTIESAIERVINEELSGVKIFGEPKFQGVKSVVSERGGHIQIYYSVLLDSNNDELNRLGKLFDASKLTDNEVIEKDSAVKAVKDYSK